MTESSSAVAATCGGLTKGELAAMRNSDARRPGSVVLALCMSLGSCSSDPTSRGEVARAYLESWYRGDGSRRALEFTEVPDKFPREYRTEIRLVGDEPDAAGVGPPLSAPAGPVAVRSVARRQMHSTGPGASEAALEYVFTMTEQRTRSAGNIVCVYAHFDVELDDGSRQFAEVYLRPDIPFAPGPVVGTDSRWKVVPGAR